MVRANPYRAVYHIRSPVLQRWRSNTGAMDGTRNYRSGKTGRGTLRVLAALCALGASAIPAGALAQNVDSTVGVDVLDDSRVYKTADLDFGRLLAGTGGGTITVATDGEVTTGGTVVSVGGTEPAAFVLERQIGVDYLTYVAPTVSDTIEIVHESDPDVTMTVRNFTNDFSRTKQGQYFIRVGGRVFGPFTGTVPGYWNQTEYDFRVGGTLDVDANQLGGTYTGSFTVTIDFN